MRLCLAAAVLSSVVVVACSVQDPGVRSRQAEQITVATDEPTVPSTDAAPAATLAAPLFVSAPTAVIDDAPRMTVPHAQQDSEQAIHALTTTSDGWLAVGSMTEAGVPGHSTVWGVSMDGTFGPATPLPTPGDVPSVARDAISDASGTIVVGSRGSGRESIATAWLLGVDLAWSMIDLPLDLARTYGAIADRVLRLADGTTVVIGRDNGPFYSDLVLWWSADGVASWTSSLPGMKSFLEPLVATDGTRVALFVRSYPNGVTNYAGHETAVFAMQGADLAALEIQAVDLAPDRRYWPHALLWDGTQFVVGMQLDVGPAVATSTDGVNYSVTEFTAPGLDSTAGAGVVGMTMLDGSLVVEIEEQATLSLFRRDGEQFTALDVPHTPSGSLGYLDYRRLSASDGHRFAYVGDWDGLTMLRWDGAAWTIGPVLGLSTFRNSARLEVRTIVSAAGSDLALLSEGYTNAPGVFVDRPAGLLSTHRIAGVA